jgi:hypothetical protein
MKPKLSSAMSCLALCALLVSMPAAYPVTADKDDHSRTK